MAATLVVAGFMAEVEEDFMAAVEDFTVVAGAMRAVVEASPAEVTAAEDPHQCPDTAARLAEAVVIRTARMAAHHIHKADSVEAGRE